MPWMQQCSCGEWVADEDWHLCGDPPVATVPPMETDIRKALHAVRDRADHVAAGGDTLTRRRSYVACLREAQRALTEALEMVQEAEEHR